MPAECTHHDIGALLLAVFGDKLYGGVICHETHADGGHHYHAAIFGDIPKRGALLRKFNDKSSQWGCEAGVNLPVGGNHIQFSHTLAKNVPWPFLGERGMLSYLTKSTAKKTVDPAPLWFTVANGDASALEHVTQDDVIDGYRERFPAKAGLMARAAIVKEMAENGAPTAEVIETLMEDTTRENAHEFAMLIQLFNATAKIVEAVDLPIFEPRPWQKLVLDWMLMPLDPKDNNKRGLWLHCPPNSGKSTLITMLKSIAGVDAVFIPAERTETYNTQSMNGYDGQKIIALDDTRGYTNDTGGTVHKASFIKFIKAIASGDDMVYTMYNKVFKHKPFARILITSNYAMPHVNEEDENFALRRRYLELQSIDIDQVAKDLGLPRDLATRQGELVGVIAAPPVIQQPVPVQAQPTHFGAQGPIEMIDLITPPVSPVTEAPEMGSGNPAPRTRRRITQYPSDDEGVEEEKDSQMSDL